MNEFEMLRPLPSYQPECVVVEARERSTDEYHSYVPCFCMQCKNFTMTLELGRMSTWRLPDFSALLMAFSASLSTLVLTILSKVRFSTRWEEVRYLVERR